jgi:quinolinate synthase
MSGGPRRRRTPGAARHALWKDQLVSLLTSTPQGFTEPAPSALLLLGRGVDLASERGVECTGALPPASAPDLVERARVARAALGDRAFVLGHHYQRDEVIAFADVTGDSFKLAREAAARPEAEYILFCGVHFMAESADILTSDAQQVLLPDLAAGCSMADMAAIDQVEDAWDVLADAGVADDTVPVTYMNSTAAIKAFTGRHGGTVCTSSNADVALRWAFDQVGGVNGSGKVLFMPDQHLGRNTAVRQLGMSLDECVVFDPRRPGGGLTPQQLKDARMILWRGHCSVHGRFSRRNVADIRAAVPDVTVLVHPECTHDVVEAADLVGSTEYIIRALDAAESGSSWAIGTELNLVRRLATTHPDLDVHYLDSTVCFCSTMNRIDLPHLVWMMESLVAGRVVNRIVVDPDDAHWARVALDQMLALPGA